MKILWRSKQAVKFLEQHNNCELDRPSCRRQTDRPMETVCCWLLLGVMVSAGSGCGGGQSHAGRHAVSGKITLDDKPLETGTIAFSLQGAKRSAPIGGAMIRGGRYDLPAAKGLPLGEYVVRINSFGAAVETTQAADGEDYFAAMRAPPPPEIIPSKYNSKTTLSAEVIADETNELDFKLESR